MLKKSAIKDKKTLNRTGTLPELKPISLLKKCPFSLDEKEPLQMRKIVTKLD